MAEKNELRSGENLFSTISLPAGSKVPDPSTGLSTSEEYDLYFCILRDNPGLLEWSRMCLSVYDAQLKDLDQTSLTADEKVEILKGILLVQRVTLEKWVKTGESLRKEV